jgi:hypothetical protein
MGRLPFGPMMLDLQGFYQSSLNKSLWRLFIQDPARDARAHHL